MSTIKSAPTLPDMTEDTGSPADPGHDAWMRKKIEVALYRKQNGRATYRPLDEVAAKFGFHAR